MTTASMGATDEAPIRTLIHDLARALRAKDAKGVQTVRLREIGGAWKIAHERSPAYMDGAWCERLDRLQAHLATV
jgi:ketosteroid isomerase-like protein